MCRRGRRCPLTSSGHATTAGATDRGSGTSNLADFNQSAPYSTNTLGTPTIACFMVGTQIATPEGTRLIERPAPGDLVLTAGGRAVAMVWLAESTHGESFIDYTGQERFEYHADYQAL